MTTKEAKRIIADARAAGVRVDLRGALLRGADLRDAQLRYADLSGAQLRGADLCGAQLRGALLRGADLCGAHLSDADLSGSQLSYADLCGAQLCGAILSDADLRDAQLSYADLRGAHLNGAQLRAAQLRGAKTHGVRWPAPSMVLLANWGTVSDELIVDLMMYDASNHPDPYAFDRWASTDACPYCGCQVQRSANFTERRDLWPGWNPRKKVQSAYRLMTRLIKEKCDNDN